MNNEYGIYYVGLKALLQKDGKVLLLRDKKTGRLDLPGGRIDSTEFEVPLEEILTREIREELGDDIVCRLGKPLFQYRRYNMERNMPVFLTVYEATVVSGEVRLSEEHSSYEWAEPKGMKFTEADFGNSNECIAMQKAFDRLSGVQ